MDIKKLKIDKFQNIKLINFPDDISLGIKSKDSSIEVVIYYISEIYDIERFVKFCNDVELPKDNRVIMVFKKGRKDGINRDSIITPFKDKKYSGFGFKAPMLCSLSEELSAFTLAKLN